MKKSAFLFILIFTIQLSYAKDIVKLNASHSSKDVRYQYPLKLLVMALDSTKQKYGEYEIKFAPTLLKRDRALKELKVGNLINVHSTPTRQEWEKSIEPIYFPIRKGILGYRVFLINKQDQIKFNNITSLDEIKEFRAGLGEQWSTTKTMKKAGFNVVTGSSYEGLFSMLEKQRFDYFPRGINEVFLEFDNRKKEFPNMVIEDSIVLYSPLPTYFFVSTKFPRLKKRIHEGLKRLEQNGEFEKLFMQYHEEFIQQAQLKKRKVYKVNN